MKGWLLDTHVIAQIARPGSDARAEAWIRGQPESLLFVSVLSLGEFDKGIHKLSPGAPGRQGLRAAVDALEARFAGRVLPVSDPVVRRWGQISGDVQRKAGRAPPVIDTLLAATAIEHALYLATRNVKDVAESGAAIFDPWRDDPAHFPIR